MSKTLLDLVQQYPRRETGSEAAAKVAQAISAQASELNNQVVKEKISVFSFETSLTVFAVCSLAAVAAGFFFPAAGLVIQAILWLLLLREVTFPFFAKIKAGDGENLILNIPARSKETQKIILTAGYDTADFMAAPLGLANKTYWQINMFLGLTVPVLQLLSITSKLHSLSLWSPIPLLIMIVLAVIPRKSSQSLSGLGGCAVLLELAALLTRFRPSITTVVLCFTGSQSLNSGIQKLLPMFKGEIPVYNLNLLEQNREQIGIVINEGFIPQSGNQLLAEILTEVAKEKRIPVENVTVQDVTPSYPLLNKKLNVITIVHSKEGAIQDLRELLVGTIRKIEH